MPSNLHLFSSPGERDIDDIVQACRPYVEGKEEPAIAYLPLASLYAERWLEMTEDAFKGLAELKTINTELMTPKAIESIIRDA